MTMMTSLKTLLFSTAAGPAGAGVGTTPLTPDGAADFAMLLGGVVGNAAPAVPNAVPEQFAPEAPADVATVSTAAILNTKAGFASAIARAENASERIAQDAVSAVVVEAAASHMKPDMAAATPSVDSEHFEIPAPTDEDAEEVSEQSDDKPGEPVEDIHSADTLVPSMPVVVTPISVAPQAPVSIVEPATAAVQAGPKTAAVQAEPAPPVMRRVATSPAPAQVASIAPEQAGLAPDRQLTELATAAKPDMPSGKTVPQVSVASSEPAVPESMPRQAEAAKNITQDMPSGKTVPQLPTAPVDPTATAQSPAADIVKALPDGPPVTVQPAKAQLSASKPAVAEAAQADPAKVVALPVAQQATSFSPASSPTPVAAHAPLVADPTIATTSIVDGTDAPAMTEAAQPQPKAAHTAAPRADAVSLLQFVRDHLSARATPRDAAPVAKAASDAPVAQTIDASAVANAPTPILSAAAPAQSTVAPTIIAPATPDLSASLGAQVVDMGVQGQWIDGLARDIAGLSANGAQGRFQIDTQQLGPVQVAIRQDADGAAVSLTVASKAAEDALRQDSDRLRLDAGLQAIRINEVKIERAPHVAEAARTDSQTQQQGSQQQGGQQQGQQASWQNMGQNANQSAQQGRWQGRENFSGGHKAGADASVLKQAEAGDSTRDGPRARYA